MQVQTLQHHIVTLAAWEETDAPVLACYLNLDKRATAYRDVPAGRVLTLKESLDPPQRFRADAAPSTIEGYPRERRRGGDFGRVLAW
jgi:hypothetical protein